MAMFIQDKIFGLSFSTYFLLGLSGIIGIGLGDSFWFQSILTVGPRITLLFELMGPLITFVITMIIFQHVQSFLAWLGMILTMLGIYMVIFDDENTNLNSRKNSLSLKIS